ncbi:MAG: circularly permuted type 2 ATP-grasp protein [Rhodospirillales bacterium]
MDQANNAASTQGIFLSDTYAPIDGVYDEMMDAGTGVRGHWQHFLESMGRFSKTELQERWDTAQRLVRENGTTYNIYDETGESTRPWRMDPIPFLIGPDEWQALEAGLIQRAKLLNAVVQDIYGEQTLLKRGLLPSSLIFGNPDFLRAMSGIKPPGGVHLHFLAFDLARAADQRWWVLSDRTQAPSGAGYTLENRIVLARTLPDIFRDAQVHRLAGFFQALSDNLISLTGKDDPLAVLLTPGPHNETYFEHAYLARYLGFPLVEGADLTVRDNKVFLKTLNGLKQVDLILRRVDSDFCDPLELRTDSLLGVAGLVAAVRAGNVLIANSLGSGIVECEALMGFYPGLCRDILGEDIKIPSLATWWCGQEQEREYVSHHLDDLVLRPTFSNSSILNNRKGALLPGQANGERRQEIVDLLSRRGYQYFGQETLTLSTTPGWSEKGIEPRPVVLRVYLCADGDGYRVMPGGLTRTADSVNAQAVTMQQGDSSKDTWVLSDSPVSTFTRLTPPDHAVTLRRSGNDLPSRVADNLFWLGRYAERTESSVRLIRAMILRLAGEAGAGDDPQTLTRLTTILVDLDYLNRRTANKAVHGGIRAVERELAMILFDRGRANGLLNLLGNLQRTASLVRERLSTDSWRVLNALHERAVGQASTIRLDVNAALEFLNHILEELSAFSGMQMENMTRSLGWRLLDTGRRVDRTTHTAKLIRELVVDGNPAEEGRLDLLLELGDSSMTYRTRYLSTVQLPAVVDLLLVDDTNPRSLAFQVATLADHMRHFPADDERATLPREEYLVQSMDSQLRLADVLALCERRNKRGQRIELAQFLDRISDQTLEMSDALARKYFSHVLPTRSTSAGGVVP